MNRVFLVGRIVKDPELKHSSSKIPYVRLRIAVNRPYKDEKKKRITDFFDVVYFNKKAEIICKYLDKGNPVSIEATLQTNSYKNKEGKNISTIDLMGEDFHFFETKVQADARRAKTKKDSKDDKNNKTEMNNEV